jgi:hypothetical protein
MLLNIRNLQQENSQLKQKLEILKGDKEWNGLKQKNKR